MNALSNKRGSSYVSVCVVVIVIAAILAVVFFYATTKSTIETTRDNTRRVLDSYVMKHSIDIYNHIKQGSDFTEELNDFIYNSGILSELSLDCSDELIYCVDENGDMVYKMTKPSLSYQVDNTLKLTASYDLMMPVIICGITVSWFTVPLEVTSSLTLK